MKEAIPEMLTDFNSFFIAISTSPPFICIVIMLDAHNPNLIIRHKVLNGKSEDVVVNNIKLQKWTHVFVVVKNRQISVFIDKVMTKGFILSGMPDLKKSRMEISSDGGFNGKLYALKYFNRAAEYDDVDREYRVNKRVLK